VLEKGRIAMAINTLRKGAKIKYIGNQQHMIEAWGNSTHRVLHKCGSSVVGYFPCKYSDGKIHMCKYSVSIKDVEIVK